VRVCPDAHLPCAIADRPVSMASGMAKFIFQLLSRLPSRLFALLVLLCGVLSGAHADTRYRDLVFTDVDVQSDIVFGAGRRAGSTDQVLAMDVYTPAGDTLRTRPVIVLAFPGGFVRGSRTDDSMVFLAEQFARRGYVAASIDYRLIEDSPDSNADVEIGISIGCSGCDAR